VLSSNGLRRPLDRALLRDARGVSRGKLWIAVVVMVLVVAAGCTSGSKSARRGGTSTSKPVPTTTGQPNTTTAVPATTLPSAPDTTLRTAPTVAPSTLGLTEAWFQGAGFGEVEPSTVFLGGDPTGMVTSIHWSSWGGAEATGSGTGWYVPPKAVTAGGSHQPATVIAFDLGSCAEHPAYQKVEWYFAGEHEGFDPSQALYACAEGYARQGTTVSAYSPWATATSLFGDMKVVKTLSGVGCSGPSAFDVGDQDAWRCNLQGGGFYDPCFAPGPPQQSNVTEVACADDPWSAVTLIKLSRALVSSSWGTPTDNLRHPWAMQLINGDKCGLIEGTGDVVHGVTLNYGCTYGGAIYPTQNTEPWKTMYSPNSTGTATASPVATAWP
jgi:hypothetical protein